MTVVSGLFERVRETVGDKDFVTELLVLGDRLMDCVKEIDADSEKEPCSLFDILCDTDALRVVLRVRVLLLDTLGLRDDDGGIAEPVALLDKLREALPETLLESCTEGDGVILSPKDPLRDGVAGFERDTVCDTEAERVAVDEQDMKKGLQERVTLTVGALLLDTLALREDDGGIPEPVALFETLAETVTDTLCEAWTERDGLMLSPNDPLRVELAAFEGDTEVDLELLFDTVCDKEAERVAVDEQDMKNGLQERVALAVGALLLDTLALREDDGGIGEPVALLDTLRDVETKTDAVLL